MAPKGNNETEKTPKVAPKSFMAIGPTLHYSHRNVQRCWLLSVAAFCLCCIFWSRVVNGSFWSFDFEVLNDPEFWRLGRLSTAGVNIFEYSWQILVLGLLMGVLAVTPVLVSQLLSFSYSFVFILAVFFLANMPGLAACLLVSCIGIACRPLRFRSRIIAVALCTAPQLIYWGCLGGARGVEPVEWGFSFAPWICAWLVGLAVAGLVLGIGHYTRYRPGLVWLFTTAVLLMAIAIFENKIGFNELDYQLYVAKNDPDQASEFHDRSITDALDRTIKNPAVRRYLAGFFYPTEPIPLRAELKKEIQIQLRYDRWPSWFILSDELRYQDKKQWLNRQYELFMNPLKPWWMPTFLHEPLNKRRSMSKRMSIALYYKALLSEYSPDIELLEQKELLHFYSDYPQERSREIWYKLYENFGDSPESLEACWRIARHYAGRGLFELADELISETQAVIQRRLEMIEREHVHSDSIFSAFRPPADSVMTEAKLNELHRRLSELRNLISSENISDKPESAGWLARFVILNPHSLDYSDQLDALLKEMDDKAPLRGNVLLAQAKLIADTQRQAERLTELHKKFPQTDGGMQALYELARLKIGLYQNESNAEQKKKLLSDARVTLSNFLDLYPDCFYAEQVKKNLESLPMVE